MRITIVSLLWFYLTATPLFASAHVAKPVDFEGFSEVKIVLDENTTLKTLESLETAPGGGLRILDDGQTVKMQIPRESVDELIEAGADVSVMRNFVLMQGNTGGGISDTVIGDEVTADSGFLYGQNDANITIPPGSWAYSDIPFTSWPDWLLVTTVDVHYDVYASTGLLDLELSDETYSYVLLSDANTGGGLVSDTVLGITYFEGRSVSQYWLLWAFEDPGDGSGLIDYWWLKLYYDDYCPAQSLDCGFEYISNVLVGTIDNSSDCNPYSDYTGLSTGMEIDTAYPITITTTNDYMSDKCGIWIDWNQNKDFNDAGELIAAMDNPGTGVYETVITPPPGAGPGSVRMRIRLLDSDFHPYSLYPCGTCIYGEVEDYNIVIPSDGPYYGGGSGIATDPYLIYTPEHLQTLGATPEHWNQYFKLMDDINLADYTGTSFNIIGTSDMNAFTGNFNGNDHYIYNFSYEVSGRSCIGLFGCISGSTAVVGDLSLINPDINAVDGQNVGALVGKNLGGTIWRCDVQGGEIRGDDTYYLGGLVGHINSGDILQCYSTALVYAKGIYGGLVGNAEICYIDECYAAGEIDSPQGIPVISPGGLIGESAASTVTDSYWDTEASGTEISAGGVGKTTEQMYQQSTFTGWNFSTPVWVICESWDYPRLHRLGFKYAGGKGTSSEPYLIRTPCDMQDIGANSDDWVKHFRLIADINLIDYTGEQFNRIGAFFGVFDGDGHSISNFSYSYAGTNSSTIGIFSGVHGLTSEVKNLVIINPNVDSGDGAFAASLVGKLTNGTVSNCRVQGGSITGDTLFALAGLVGDMEGGSVVNCDCNIVINPTNGRGAGIVGNTWTSTSPTISGCVFRGQVSGNDGAGGIVGENYGIVEYCQVTGEVTAQQQAGGITSENHGIIRQSFCDGQVTAVGSEAGGIAGRNFDNILDCYSTAQVTAGSTAGGLVGLNWSGNVTKCYAAGPVSGSGGGLIGAAIDGNAFDSFWDVNTSGKTYSDGGTGLPTSQMYKYATFDSAGWDFADTWKICENQTYPKLRWERYSGGNGKKQNPCIICFAEEMQQIGAHREDWNKHFRLARDIDMSLYTGTQYNPIGKFASYSAGGGYFTGSFDGGRNKIYNLSYTTAEKVYGIGLFGFVAGRDELVEIKDLTLVDPYIDVGPGGDTGSLVGIMAYDTRISNCHVVNAVIRGDGGLGGLVGGTMAGSSGSIDKCSATVDIVATSGHQDLSGSAGGLVGLNNFTRINQCYTTGGIISDGGIVGGLCGFSGGPVSNCYSTVNVDANDIVGGLMGYNGAEVTNCYSAGAVAGDSNYVQGFIGISLGGPVEGCFWDVNSSGQTGPGQATGLTTAQMQDPNTFLLAGWDFIGEFTNGPNEIWRLCPDESQYAVLTWQLPLGDFLCPSGVEENDLGYLCDDWLLYETKLDIAPAGGDGRVDFADWSVFAAAWRSQSGRPDYNPDCDVVQNGKIDEADLREFIKYWLTMGDVSLLTDIYPQPDGDGVVNIYDFALFAQRWMTGE